MALEPSLGDLKYYDEQLYNSMTYISNPEINVEDLCMNFTIMDQGKTVELKPDGENVSLTNENRDEYINLLIEYYTSMRVPNQTFAFVSSFLAIVPHDYL